MSKWKCRTCGYIYDEARQEKKFEDLPDDYICPKCRAPKSRFAKIPFS